MLIAVANASVIFAQTTPAAPAKLVLKNAVILTMAAGQREPLKGYLVVGEDHGRKSGDPVEVVGENAVLIGGLPIPSAQARLDWPTGS